MQEYPNMTYNLQSYFFNGLIVPMEFWRPITQEMVPNVQPIYYVSNLGNIYNSKKNTYSNITLHPGNYVQVSLRTVDGGQISIHIHRLVCMAFHGLPPSPDHEVDHVNCDKTCNYEGNLEWVTAKENINRACINDLIKFGEDNYRAILTNDDVTMICELLMQKVPIKEICAIMEKHIYPRIYQSGFKGLISHLLRKDIWRDITEKYNFPDYSKNFSDEEVHLICSCLSRGESYKDIMIKLGVNLDDPDEVYRARENIYKIKIGSTYTHISCNYHIDIRKSKVLTNDELEFVCMKIAEGLSAKEVIDMMGERGATRSVRETIKTIANGICFKDIVDKYKLMVEGSTTIS